MSRIKLSDEEWARILASLKKLPGVHIGLPYICRQFVSASLWILRTGAQWLVLPPTYGKWNSVFRVGASMAYEKKSSVIFLKMPIYKMFLWMARSSGRMPARLGRQTAKPKRKRLGVPKAGLVVRFIRFVMPWVCQSNSS
jgi:hypothetical protein